MAGLLAAAFLGAAGAAHAGGGWVRPRGSSYLEASLLASSTMTIYGPGGAVEPYRRFSTIDRPTTYRDLGLVTYGEVGLGGGFGLDGDLLFKRVEVEEPATLFANSGPADLRLRLKRGFRAGVVAWAIAAETWLPLFYDENDDPALGSGGIDGALLVAAGVGSAAGWVQAEIGARARGGAPVGEWPYAAQVGWNATPRWALIGDLVGHGRLGVAEAAPPGAEFDPALASSTVLEVGPGLAVSAESGWRISAQGWRTLSGRNVPEGWKWKLAVARVR